MLSFACDYTAGAHPEILTKLMETNQMPLPGYGEDCFTKSAAAKIQAACDCPDAQVYFTVGGTQANQLVISTLLSDCEGVLAADTGHISTHEAGAIEYSGHKVLTLPSHQGKIQCAELDAFLKSYYADENHSHMVFPGMVYISHPTEYGSLYTKSELYTLSKICRSYHMPLYIDGARLAYALACKETDVTLPDIARLADVFCIGGTKAGALCGEAIVFTKGSMPPRFTALAKQRGALLSKGRLLGVQFDTLFTDGLYFQNGQHALLQKDKMIHILKNAGLSFYYESPTNQQFLLLENTLRKKLEEKVCVGFWEVYDDNHTIVRFATSWSTTDEDLKELEKILQALEIKN